MFKERKVKMDKKKVKKGKITTKLNKSQAEDYVKPITKKELVEYRTVELTEEEYQLIDKWRKSTWKKSL